MTETIKVCKMLKTADFKIEPFELLNTPRTDWEEAIYFNELWALEKEPLLFLKSRLKRTPQYAEFGKGGRGLLNIVLALMRRGDPYDKFIELCETIYAEEGANLFPPKHQTLHVKEFYIEPYEALNGTIDRPSKIPYLRDIYYFDYNWVLHIVPLEEAYELGVKGCYRVLKTRQGLPQEAYYRGYQYIELGNNSKVLFNKALRVLRDGDTYAKFIEICEKITNEGELFQSNFERFVGKINRPVIERETGNHKKNTFDFIRVSVGINKIEDRPLKESVEEYYEEIKQVVLEKIENHGPFQKFNVPINCLRLTQATLTTQSELIFLFELKELNLTDSEEMAM